MDALEAEILSEQRFRMSLMTATLATPAVDVDTRKSLLKRSAEELALMDSYAILDLPAVKDLLAKRDTTAVTKIYEALAAAGIVNASKDE